MDTSLSPSSSSQSPPDPPKPTPEQLSRQVLQSHSVRLFRPSQTRFDPRRIQLPDDFFQPTISELTTASNSLSSSLHKLTDPPMMTSKMRQAQTEQRMSHFRKVLIRVLFPDRIALQGTFEPASTVRHVQRFVRAALRDARNVKFHLFVVPPKTRLMDLDVNLWSLGLVPAALLHIAIDEGPQTSQQLLKEWVLDSIEETPELETYVPQIVHVKQDEEVAKSHEAPPEKKSLTKSKIPKWFKK